MEWGGHMKFWYVPVTTCTVHEAQVKLNKLFKNSLS